MNVVRPALVLLSAGLATAPLAARAAESYDNCTGFIDSLPATISSQGTWCLRKDLATAMSAGEAITVAANNVTLDCNRFKVGGLAAGNRSGATGIYAAGRQNVTVRHCLIRGFHTAINLNGGAGHVVEENRIDNSLHAGIALTGEGGLVRGNQVYDTGGLVDSNLSYAIGADADVIDNTVDGVFGTAPDVYPWGILIGQMGGVARGNIVRGLVPAGAGTANALYATNEGITFADNRVHSQSPIVGRGISGHGMTFCIGNTLMNFGTPIQSCTDAGGNTSR